MAEKTDEENLVLELAVDVSAEHAELLKQQLAIQLIKDYEYPDREVWLCCDAEYLEELLKRIKTRKHRVIDFSLE